MHGSLCSTIVDGGPDLLELVDNRKNGQFLNNVRYLFVVDVVDFMMGNQCQRSYSGSFSLVMPSDVSVRLADRNSGIKFQRKRPVQGGLHGLCPT